MTVGEIQDLLKSNAYNGFPVVVSRWDGSGNVAWAEWRKRKRKRLEATLFVPGGFSARDYGIVAVCSLFVCSFVVSTMKYLLKFYSDWFEILSADFFWPS